MVRHLDSALLHILLLADNSLEISVLFSKLLAPEAFYCVVLGRSSVLILGFCPEWDSKFVATLVFVFLH